MLLLLLLLPQGLDQLPALEELRVSSNLLQKLESLQSLHRLRLLDVASNRVRGPQAQTASDNSQSLNQIILIIIVV